MAGLPAGELWSLPLLLEGGWRFLRAPALCRCEESWRGAEAGDSLLKGPLLPVIFLVFFFLEVKKIPDLLHLRQGQNGVMVGAPPPQEVITI